MLCCAVCRRQAAGSRGSVLYSMFWNVWEKMTLSSKALQQLAELLVETTLWALHSSEVLDHAYYILRLSLMVVVNDGGLCIHVNSSSGVLNRNLNCVLFELVLTAR